MPSNGQCNITNFGLRRKMQEESSAIAPWRRSGPSFYLPMQKRLKMRSSTSSV